MGERRGGGGGWASATMDLLRSEPMQLAQLIIPVESAHRTISYLGDLALFQFKDVSTWNNLFLSFSSSHFYNSYFLFLILLNPLWSAIPCLEFDIHWMFVIAEDHDCKNCIYFHLPFLLFGFWIYIYIYLCLCAKLKWYHGSERLRNEKFIVHCSDWTFSWLIHDWTFLLWYFKL